MSFTQSSIEAPVRAKLRTAVLLLLSAAAFTFIGCAKPPPPPVEIEEPAPPPPFEHTVQFRGETLGFIARWYTGDLKKWPLIAEANPGLRPERINIGDKITIPRELLVTEEVMPQSSIPRSAGVVPKTNTVPSDDEAAVIGDAPAPSDSGGVDQVSVDDLLGEIAAEREKQDTPEVTGSNTKEAAAALRELEAQVADSPPQVEPPVEETPPVDDAERDRLLNELLAQ